ncbi:MAG: 4-hydroxybenzoate octaprenyltransferase [Candidatus Endonucleobacter bathymodioli]|uniref:4-hydroxybenzoate octaprenyltransferase n=1 Tax=Candidatus Endonucleibacter bathymodioli TaxID=539814 RepID=A0AA90P155_9GAMM|nr:4-hydroxybenzoate octaprenyltransferase [Candidatus Endonucleobacter bathymodioli]
MRHLDTTRIKDFVSLARLNRPIGIYLLFWPTMWALWLAAGGMPKTHNFIVFSLGVILMRSAGCVINDYADRHFDGHVKRTADRPLPCGRISEKEALSFFVVLFTLAFILVLTTNLLTIGLAFAGLFLASFYPFAKRYTYLPQVVLGLAYSLSIPMAFAAENNQIITNVWLLFIANLLWTVAYDTQYAMVDREDDLKTGIKSTAILFGNLDNFMISLLQFSAVFSLAIMGVKMELGIIFYLSLLCASGLFITQQLMTNNREPDACFKAFLSNHWVGVIIFIGILMGQ